MKIKKVNELNDFNSDMSLLDKINNTQTKTVTITKEIPYTLWDKVRKLRDELQETQFKDAEKSHFIRNGYKEPKKIIFTLKNGDVYEVNLTIKHKVKHKVITEKTLGTIISYDIAK